MADSKKVLRAKCLQTGKLLTDTNTNGINYSDAIRKIFTTTHFNTTSSTAVIFSKIEKQKITDFSRSNQSHFVSDKPTNKS